LEKGISFPPVVVPLSVLPFYLVVWGDREKIFRIEIRKEDSEKPIEQVGWMGDRDCASLLWWKPFLTWLEGWRNGRELSFPPAFRLTRSPGVEKVYRAISSIPLGTVRSYGEVAESLFLKKGARGVASICRGNPFPLLIPCHRVVGKRGLGGYSGEGGVFTKSMLLSYEKEVSRGKIKV
jgi:O-6-methylguanine DNA methyltransferase